MKHLKRANIYKANNVTFNPETFEAYSYGWWIFVCLIDGKLIFNNYNYSNTTCKHQSKVRKLLRELNLKIDLTIEAPSGLQDLLPAKRHYQSMIVDLKEQIAKPRTHKAKNAERRQQIAAHRIKIKQINALIKRQEYDAA